MSRLDLPFRVRNSSGVGPNRFLLLQVHRTEFNFFIICSLKNVAKYRLILICVASINMTSFVLRFISRLVHNTTPNLRSVVAYGFFTRCENGNDHLRNQELYSRHRWVHICNVVPYVQKMILSDFCRSWKCHISKFDQTFLISMSTKPKCQEDGNFLAPMSVLWHRWFVTKLTFLPQFINFWHNWMTSRTFSDI